jgi:two-component system OmpR family sensor kinase
VTLRLRLLLLLVAIVAAGLLISDVVTYHALQSFLTTREDQQLEQAAFPVGRALFSSSGLGIEVPAAPPSGVGSSSSSSKGRPGVTIPRQYRGSFRNGGGLFSDGSNGREVVVTPGTFGQLRSAAGRVEAHLFFSYGTTAPSAPVVPARLPGSGLPAGKDLFFTTTSRGPDRVSYRMVAKALSDGRGVIVVAVPLTDLESTLRQLLLVEVVVSALLLLGLGVVAWVMVRRDLRPLEEITEAAGAIAAGDLSQRVSHVTAGTEVGQLGVAFNTMIDEIEVAFAERTASEDRLRRFLADASHELRTPLTSILGYAELFDLGIRDRPEDLATSMRHIKDEAARMGTLVDDLLWLSKLDRERPLAREAVDLAELVDRSVTALAASAPDRPVSVRTTDPVVVSGDEHRLRQVVDNLVVNAVTHTPAGTAVEVGVATDGPIAVLTVHDDGPGVDPADAARIFQPFYRSDPSRARASGGAGLGLAIVAAIVEAHGGTVGVDSGPGATFEVRIPLAGPEPVDRDGDPESVPGGNGGDGGNRSNGGATDATVITGPIDTGSVDTGPIDTGLVEPSPSRR